MTFMTKIFKKLKDIFLPIFRTNCTNLFNIFRILKLKFNVNLLQDQFLKSKFNFCQNLSGMIGGMEKASHFGL